MWGVGFGVYGSSELRVYGAGQRHDHPDTFAYFKIDTELRVAGYKLGFGGAGCRV